MKNSISYYVCLNCSNCVNIPLRKAASRVALRHVIILYLRLLRTFCCCLPAFFCIQQSQCFVRHVCCLQWIIQMMYFMLCEYFAAF